MSTLTDTVGDKQIVIGVYTDIVEMCKKTLERILERQELIGQKLEAGDYIARVIVGVGKKNHI